MFTITSEAYVQTPLRILLINNFNVIELIQEYLIGVTVTWFFENIRLLLFLQSYTFGKFVLFSFCDLSFVIKYVLLHRNGSHRYHHNDVIKKVRDNDKEVAEEETDNFTID